MEKIILYHGSTKIITKPEKNKGKSYNDYGQGFYLTKEKEIASEWACMNQNQDGFINKYSLNTDSLRILTLNQDYTILHWLAILLDNRRFDITLPQAKFSKEYIMKNFLLDYKKYDVIIGYRADDSYFSFARDFINNAISIEQLSEAMTLGKLGMQIFIQSEKAFSQLEYQSFETVKSEIYFPLHQERALNARKTYLSLHQEFSSKDLFIRDIIIKEMTGENESIPRIHLK